MPSNTLSSAIGLLSLALAAASPAELPVETPPPIELPRAVPGAPHPIRIDEILGLREVTALSLSPDGRTVAFALQQARPEADAYASAIFITSADASERSGIAPRKLADIGDVAGLRWTTDSRYVTYIAPVDGVRQVWRIPAAGGKPERITAQPSGVATGLATERVSTFPQYEFSPDGRSLAYFAWDIEGAKAAAKEREKKPFVFDEATVQSSLDVMRPPTWRMIPLHADLHLMDLRTGRAEKVWTSPGTMQVSDDPAGTIPPELAWSPDGKTIALTFPPALEAGQYFVRQFGLYTLADRRFRPVLTDIGWTLFARWLPDGSALSMLSEGRIVAGKPRYGMRTYEYRLADGSFREVPAATDVASQAGRAIAAKSNARVTECTTSADLHRVACLYETPRTPPEIAVARLEKDGQVSGVRPVTSLNPEYGNIRIGEVTQLSWAWPGGREDRPGATLIKPVGFVAGKKYPLLVMLYNQGDRNRFVYQTWANWPTQAFAAKGYAVLLVNFPPSSFQAGDFQGAKRAEADAPVECIEKAVGLVKAMGFLDETRMGILGWSWGSYVASYLISHYPDRFQAAASSEGGLYNISSHWMSVGEGRQFIESPFGGGPYPRFLEKWTQMSPTMSAHRVKIPVLQEYSTRNPNGLEFSAAVNSQGGAAEIVFYPDEVHVFLDPANRLHSMRLNYDWFNFWLLGEEDPDPSKRPQYDRWRALRETLARRPRDDRP